MYTSFSEVEDLVKPHEDTLVAVHDWLSSHGIDVKKDVTRNSAGDWISLKLPLSKVENMLTAKYHIYKHKRTDELLVRTTSYSLPEGLHDHIDIVMPTTMFDNMRKMHATIHVNDINSNVDQSGTLQQLPDVTGPAGQNISASCNTTITPTCLMQLYRTEGYTPTAAKKGNRIGVNGFLEQVRL